MLFKWTFNESENFELATRLAMLPDPTGGSDPDSIMGEWLTVLPPAGSHFNHWHPTVSEHQKQHKNYPQQMINGRSRKKA